MQSPRSEGEWGLLFVLNKMHQLVKDILFVQKSFYYFVIYTLQENIPLQ
jgi:hypothetical protein